MKHCDCVCHVGHGGITKVEYTVECAYCNDYLCDKCIIGHNIDHEPLCTDCVDYEINRAEYLLGDR